MRLLKSFTAILLLSMAAITASAQNRSVSGFVYDAAQQPLIGVAVIVDGTTNGSVTDVDGSFSLEVPAKDVVLNVSSLGYETKLVNLPAGQDQITIILNEDNMMLEETVVVGYGTQKKVNLTGAVASVDEKALQDRVSPNLSSMLQGAVPGLSISTTSGNPGSTGSLLIRGTGSINGGSPLVLIDGAEGEIDRVNPNDVESISVIKDASAAAVYGARGAFGVVLITTKKGQEKDGKATVRYSGRWGWEEPTTSTDYETTGYWSVYTVNKFYDGSSSGNKYAYYTEQDMMELLARVNDKTEHPDRPWVTIQKRNGKDQYVYYANTDWYHELYNDQHPVQQHNISVSGGNKAVKYYLSGAYNRQTGILKTNPDLFGKYNLRSKIDFTVNKYIKMSNNTSFYNSSYSYSGVGNVQNAFAYGANHALASFPLKNPEGWVYKTDLISSTYAVGNGRHIVYGNDKDINVDKKTDFANTTEIRITPVKQFTLTANYTYRFHRNKSTNRSTNLEYVSAPGVTGVYDTGAGANSLGESIDTWNYNAVNVFGTYEDTYKDAHHLTVMAGYNYETQYRKDISATAYNLISDELNDLGLAVQKYDSKGQMIQVPEVDGGQSEYALMGFFGRINYDYLGRYLFEVSGRYDGSSRFAKGSRFGFFPSASAGWRISEERWFAPAKNVVDNLKVRASFGSLGNQNVSNYAYLRTVSLNPFKAFAFGSGLAQYATLSAPNASDLTWETATQYNVGVDAGLFKDRLQFTGEGYIRDTKGMLTEGVALPGIYGADSPKMNAANLRTTGYELSISWRDQFNLAGKPFGYSVRATLSDFKTVITKYDNPEKSFAKDYYVGMELGEIWGYEVDGLFQSDAEAAEYQKLVDLSYLKSGASDQQWAAGDVKYVDLDGNGKIGIGANTVEDPGDRKILGNSIASLQYGFTIGLDFFGFDFSMFLQGTGNHYWYPNTESMAFWGPFSRPYTTYLPKNMLDNCWAPDNTDAYFPRPIAYAAFSDNHQLAEINSRYLQNTRYLRLKNLTVGYTVPQNWTKKVGIEKVRVYFSGENLHYWSPLKKNSVYIDPEAALTVVDSSNKVSRYNNAFYPWQRSFMFGIDITF